jgi:hypothetical protein
MPPLPGIYMYILSIYVDLCVYKYAYLNMCLHVYENMEMD